MKEGIDWKLVAQELATVEPDWFDWESANDDDEADRLYIKSEPGEDFGYELNDYFLDDFDAGFSGIDDDLIFGQCCRAGSARGWTVEFAVDHGSDGPRSAVFISPSLLGLNPGTRSDGERPMPGQLAALELLRAHGVEIGATA